MTPLWQPLNPEFVANPYPMYARLREEDPVHLAQTGEWIITRYEDVKEILRSNKFAAGNRLEWLKKGLPYFQQKGEDISLIYEAMRSFMVLLSNQQHTRIRALVTKAWTNRQIEGIVQKNITALLRKFPAGAFDFITHFAQPLPVLTISNILGIPTEGYREIKRLGMKLTETLGLYVSLKELVAINEAARDLISFFGDQLQQKRMSPDESLISAVLQENARDPQPLSDNELISLYIFLFIAGEETSSNLLGSGLYHLLTHAQELERLKKDATLLPTCVDELLRYDASVQIAGRTCLADFKLNHKMIPAGSTVSLVIGAANRDPAVFADPDRLDIARSPNKHLTFGIGTHFCMGDWLARRQAEMAFTELFRQYPNLRLADTANIEWNKILTFRSILKMDVIT